MAVTISSFDNVKANLTGGTASGGAPIDWLTDTIKIALATTTYTPALTTHDFFDDITNELTTATGYTAGGETLASKTCSSPAAGVVTYDCADVTWTFSASKSFRYGIVYKSTGVASTSPLMFLIDFDGSTNLTAAIGTWTWQVNASGLFTIS